MRARLQSQDGISLIEVMVSALLVALIVVATYSGFDTASEAAGQTRAHAQAAQLVEQNEERLRGITENELAALGTTTKYEAENGVCVEAATTPTHYCSTTAYKSEIFTGTVFTITSSAQFVAASKGSEEEAASCETTGGSSSYIKTTSTATWTGMGTRPGVTQTSIVSTLVTGLLVRVKNQAREPVEGAIVKISGTNDNATRSTPASGCVVFAGLTPETIKVGVTDGGWVNKDGKSPPPTEEVKITGETVVSHEFQIGSPGTLAVHFKSSGVAGHVAGTTYIATQTNLDSPKVLLGGNASAVTETPEALSILFPFAEAASPHGPEAYSVYAGDCAANNLGHYAAASFTPGARQEVEVEVPVVKVKVYQHTSAEVTSGKTEVVASPEHAMIINSECSGTKALNVEPVSDEHPVTLNSSGELEQGKYQPYATKLELCIVAKVGIKQYKSKTTFKNETATGVSVGNIYLASGTLGTGQTCP